MAETIEEVSYNYEDEGKLVRKEMKKEVLTKGAWATVMFLYEELDRKTEKWGDAEGLDRPLQEVGRRLPQAVELQHLVGEAGATDRRGDRAWYAEVGPQAGAAAPRRGRSRRLTRVRRRRLIARAAALLVRLAEAIEEAADDFSFSLAHVDEAHLALGVEQRALRSCAFLNML